MTLEELLKDSCYGFAEMVVVLFRGNGFGKDQFSHVLNDCHFYLLYCFFFGGYAEAFGAGFDVVFVGNNCDFFDDLK